MSTADKRSVATDALATLGTIIDDKQKRDAIHLAVIPAIAGEDMAPGTHVALWGDRAYARDGKSYMGERCIGIVDPFLAGPVRKNERFWLVIYPRVITSLRHVWSHPLIEDELPPVKTPYEAKLSEEWLRNFCKHHDAPSYESLMVAVRGGTIHSGYGPCHNDGEYFTIMGEDAHCDIPPEFWDHVEAVTGLRNIPRAKYFSCSC